MHGAEETARIKAASAALFGGGTSRERARRPWRPHCARPGPRRRPDGRLPTSSDLLVAAGLAESKGGPADGQRGRRLPQQPPRHGPGVRPDGEDLLPGAWLVLRRGKRRSPASRSAPVHDSTPAQGVTGNPGRPPSPRCPAGVPCVSDPWGRQLRSLRGVVRGPRQPPREPVSRGERRTCGVVRPTKSHLPPLTCGDVACRPGSRRFDLDGCAGARA